MINFAQYICWSMLNVVMYACYGLLQAWCEVYMFVHCAIPLVLSVCSVSAKLLSEAHSVSV